MLTAFLIESYKNLFADESESLLRQIAHQTANYTFNNGYLNSTFNPSQLPSFKAAVSDIRVNVCWFASLILSLASASFGIAVKQWLREFLSMDYISPQERLRIRDARIHGLRDWKLFQIAAFLPILLQVSLVLFFVGLCFFTAAVHPSIGTTSLFLISCWAFLFFMSVLAPLFSPRCPYKTTILKVPFRYARPYIRTFLGLEYRQSHASLHKTTPARGEQAEASHSEPNSGNVPVNDPESVGSQFSVPTSSLGAAWLRLCVACKSAVQWVRITREAPATEEQAESPRSNSGDVLGGPPKPTCSPFAAIHSHLPGFLRGTENLQAESASPESEVIQGEFKELQYYDDCMDLEILSELLADVVAEDTVPEEEDVIRSTNRNDLIIFCNVDSAFFDDSLLARLPGALSQRPPPLHDVLRFVKTIVHRRIGLSSPSFMPEATSARKREPWPWTLSHSTRLAIVDILARTMEYWLHHSPKKWATLATGDSDWSRSFIFLGSVASTREALPESVTSMFEWGSEHIGDEPGGWNFFDLLSYQLRAPAKSHPDWPARSLLFLAQSLETLKAEDASRFLQQITYNTFIDSSITPPNNSYGLLLERTTATDDIHGDCIMPTTQTIVAVLEVARIILHNVTLEQTQAQDSFPKFTSLLLEFVFDAIPTVLKNLPDASFDQPLTGPLDGPGLYRVLTDLFTTPHTTRPLLHFLAIHSRFLSPSSQLDNDRFFLELIAHTDSSSRELLIVLQCGYLFMTHGAGEIRIMVLDACTQFFTTQATSTSSIVDSPAALFRLCLLIYQFRCRADAESILCWKKLFAATHECYKHLIHHKPHSEPSICRRVNADDQHTGTCETAYAILDYGEHWTGVNGFTSVIRLVYRILTNVFSD